MNAKMPKIRQKANTSNVTPQRHPFLMGRHIQLDSVHVLAHHSEYGNQNLRHLLSRHSLRGHYTSISVDLCKRSLTVHLLRDAQLTSRASNPFAKAAAVIWTLPSSLAYILRSCLDYDVVVFMVGQSFSPIGRM